MGEKIGAKLAKESEKNDNHEINMKLSTPEIAWHGKEPIFSVDFSQVSTSLWRLASAGGDSDIKVVIVIDKT